ncbi:PhoPQ-activated pathogenicity-like protein PqaA type [Fulvivirgaceae bacterium PWU5]|uniref:PhoPQ-activated pathogenicity-like protein PqaA type n=1 Tax=Dawidia cretensis TaxID=2782350 RepID=A0AAP2DY83_9BACT|nr:PhoPQ-activated protein PqaA family protein [Dawidia cretensis]MBT1708609.1 PhoPQ-activated pathogenicity-like protein PqaA type [Dawidia cretensis]
MMKNKVLVAIVLMLLTILFFAQSLPAQSTVTAAAALEAYLGNGDTSYRWEVKDTYTRGSVQVYNIRLVSQQWHEYRWTHQLSVLVPADCRHDGALLFITGGGNKKGEPEWRGPDDKLTVSLGDMATANHAVVAILRQTPNQPLVGDLTEDALISYTLHQFKEDGDYSWPLLFPMVKGVVRAMDAVQEFSTKTLQRDLHRFVVTGASKRGWTTWLTGASDKRVAAIAPMVIDVLNMPVNLDYQVKMLKEYSVQIQDYVKLGIPQTVHSEKGDAITAMVDPYAYRKKLTMPKMIFMGTNDEYWTVDAVKHYIDSIPGRNFIHYVPNVGHDLGDKNQAFQALSAFLGITLAHQPYTACQWNVTPGKKGVTLSVTVTPDALVDAVLWSAASDDTDFRNDTWKGQSLGLKKKTAVITTTTPYPQKGYRAFYLDLKYKDPKGGEYTESTRMFVTDNDEVFLK